MSDARFDFNEATAIYSSSGFTASHVCGVKMDIPVEVPHGWWMVGLDDEGGPFILPAPPNFHPAATEGEAT